MENCLIMHPAVAEAVVVGRPDLLKGEVAAALVALKTDYSLKAGLEDELRALVSRITGHVVVIKDILFVSSLPKTRSGKIMRRLIKAVLTQ